MSPLQGKKGKPVTSNQRVSWYVPHSGQTKAYEQQVLLGLINNTVKVTKIKRCEVAIAQPDASR